MSAIKTGAVIVAGVLALGAAGGGIRTNPDGSINPGDTLSSSANIGGDRVGQAVDRSFEGIGRGAGSALGSSDVLKAGALGAGAYGAWKAKSRYSVCWTRKSCDGTPTPEPTTVGQLPMSEGFQIDVQGR